MSAKERNMKFAVKRTSIWDEEKPIDHPKLYEERVQTQILFNDGKEPLTYWKDCWFIELETLEELVDFINFSEREIVLTTNHNRFVNEYHEIEIYDCYRE